jgi:hypothetical protein
MSLSKLLCEGTQNYKTNQNLLKDKFTAMGQINLQIVSGGGGVDNSHQNQNASSSSSAFNRSLHELKK